MFEKWRRSKSPNSAPAAPLHYRYDSAEQQEADRKALEAGGLPEKVLARMEKTRAGEIPWMSSLSAGGLLQAEGLGIDPVAQVTGSAYYHAAGDGYGRTLFDANQDAGNVIRAYYAARDLAQDRLSQEAEMVGAHGVIDLRHHFLRNELMVECTMVGTAVRFRALGTDRPRQPVLTPLSASAFLKLLQGGWWPVGLALGYHWHAMPVGYQTQMVTSAFNARNQEVPGLAEKVSEARRLALHRMERDARDVTAVDGIVGVEVGMRVEASEMVLSGGSPGQGVFVDGTWYQYEWNGRVEIPAFHVEFFATGASVARIGHAPAGKQNVQRILDRS